MINSRFLYCSLMCGFLLALTAFASLSWAESPSCEGEQRAFTRFARIAKRAGYDQSYSPNPLSHTERIKFIARDDIPLVGYVARSRDLSGEASPSTKAVLFLLGNAMLAQQVIRDMRQLSEKGFDVYAFDYRGYGESGGTASVASLINDARQLLLHLSESKNALGATYSEVHVYGISMGGAIALNAINAELSVTRIVLDGTPARLSVDIRFLVFRVMKIVCPETIEPVNLVSAIDPSYMLVQGHRDRQIGGTQDAKTQEHFLSKAAEQGATVCRPRDLAHPMTDSPETLRRTRMHGVGDFLLGTRPESLECETS